MNALVPITYRPEMFQPEIRRAMRPEGMSLLEIAHSLDLPPEFYEIGIISIGGLPIPKENWHVVRPKVIEGGQNVVTLAMTPGKGMSAAGIVGILASVALIGLTAGIGAGGLAAVLGGTAAAGVGALTFGGAGLFAAGSLSAALAAGAVGLAGSMLLSALIKPPEGDNNRARRDRPVAGISGNTLQPLSQVPGIRAAAIDYSPPFAAPTFTELVRGVIWVNAIYIVAGRNNVTNVRINNSVADDLDGVQYEVLEGDPGDGNLTLVTDTGIEGIASPIQMSEFDLKEGALDTLQDQATPTNSYPIWHGFTIRGAEWDQIWTRFQFPSGMAQQASDGDVDPAGVPVRGRMRLLGEVAWRNLPEFHFHDDSKLFKRIIKEIRFLYEAVPGGFEPFNTGTTAGADKDFVGYTAYAIAGEGEAFEWEADPYFDQGGAEIFADKVAREFDGFKVYLDPAEWEPGIYEVQWMRGLTYDSGTNFDADAYTYNGSATNANFFEHYDDGGTDKVRVDQTTFTGLAVIEQFTTFSNERPIAATADFPCPVTLIAVRSRIPIDNLTATFGSKVNIWNGANWNTVAVSGNPAALCRDVLKGALNARPLVSALVDDTNLQEFYDNCADRGLECNLVISDSVVVVQQAIASSGSAVPRQREKWGVIYERDRSGDSIVQHFTPLNSRAQPFEREFPDLPHAIYAEFHDEDDEFRLKSIPVYADGYGASTATRFEALTYAGLTSQTLVERRAMLDLRQARQRMSRYPIEIGFESILSARGDLVGFTHDVLSNHVGFGIVEDIIIGAGGNVTGLVLEAVANLADVDGPVSVAIRLADKTSIIKAIEQTANSKIITFASAFAMPTMVVNGSTIASLVKGCLISFGPVGQEYKRCIILDIEAAPEFGAKLTLVDEAPELTMVLDASSSFYTADSTIHTADETI